MKKMIVLHRAVLTKRGQRSAGTKCGRYCRDVWLEEQREHINESIQLRSCKVCVK